MNPAQLQQAILNLPPAERVDLALAVWDSLECDPTIAADQTLDPEGIELAIQRDLEIEVNPAQLLTHREFRQLTGDNET